MSFRTSALGEPFAARALPHDDLADGVESLAYWRDRHRQLPWYRRRARREAARMTIRWEQRIATPVLSPSPLPLSTRLSAGLSLGRTRLERWSRRARLVVLATVATVGVLVAVPMVAALVFLSHAL